MKKTIFIILLVFTVVSCFGAEKFIGLSLGSATFYDEDMDQLFEEPATLELRLQVFDKVNHIKGFTFSAFVTADSRSDDGFSLEYSQIGISAQLTPTLFVPISEVAGLYLYAGAGLGVVSSNMIIEFDYSPEEDYEDDETFVSFNYTAGAKLLLNNKLALDLYYQSVNGDHEDLDVGYGAICIGASIMF